MHRTINWLVLLVAGCCGGSAQSRGPSVITSSYTLVQPFSVAPGQLVTLVVDLGFPNEISRTVRAPEGADLPRSLAGITGGYGQSNTDPPNPILEVHPYWGNCPTVARGWCTNLAAITIQIPFEAKWQSTSPGGGGVPAGIISFFLGDQHGPFVYVSTVAHQVHILTACDAFMIPDAFSTRGTASGLPCDSVVSHADGSPVTAQNPAVPGETVIAYAVGLGQTEPPLQTGKLVTVPARTLATFGLDFNYRPNALASKPLPDALPPLYSGATPGYVGLYQINFEIPPPPPGTPPCVVPRNPADNVVHSNLTVSVGAGSSFDAVRLCVKVDP